MAASIGSGTSYLSTTSVPVGLQQNAAALTAALWVYLTSWTVSSGIVGGPTEPTYANLLSIVGSTKTGSAFNDAIGVRVRGDGAGAFVLQHNFTTENLEIADTDFTISLNSWTHMAITFTPAATSIYFNGDPNVVGSGSIPTAVAWDRIVVGGFAGNAQDAVVFNRALSSAEVKSLVFQRRPRVDTTGLVGFWPLAGGGQIGADMSGHGRTLSVTGSVTDATRNAPSRWTPGVVRHPPGTALTPPPSAPARLLTLHDMSHRAFRRRQGNI